jgi:hypothetical protein
MPSIRNEIPCRAVREAGKRGRVHLAPPCSDARPRIRLPSIPTRSMYRYNNPKTCPIRIFLTPWMLSKCPSPMLHHGSCGKVYMRRCSSNKGKSNYYKAQIAGYINESKVTLRLDLCWQNSLSYMGFPLHGNCLVDTLFFNIVDTILYCM